MANRYATLQLTVDTGTGSGYTTGTAVGGFGPYDYFMLDADLTNTDTGVVDVWLQRASIYGGTTTWRDWMRFPQQAASAGIKHYTATPQPANAINAVGINGAPALAANTTVGGHPGYQLRAVAYQAGAGPYLAQTQTVTVFCWQGRD